MSDVKKMGVIGAGQMGGGIAQVAAQAGIEVVCFDAAQGALDGCAKLREKLMSRGVEKEKWSQEDADATLARISYTTSLDDLGESDWVVEAIVENEDVKTELFGKLASMFAGSDAVLATNTSSISITTIATAAGDAADRVIGMHFFNPVPVMKLVEVIRGLQTSDAVAARTVALAERMGKTPVVANDRAGFVSNRILMPMINEAFYTWMEGVATPEAIDEVMKLGMAHPMGPLRLADFIGLDTCVSIMDVLADGLNSERYRACPMLKQLVAAGRLGNKTGRGVFDYSK
ncbi:MAG: 3-hydroxyacyl-CoA dehydrogenase family protein [Planctomycetota bacterium]|jgi:3-hydroxybutyryl-CoA dehydrogenase